MRSSIQNMMRSPGVFRFLLASLVFIHHLSRLAIGESAVYLFFALSGYWIAVMWRGRYSRSSSPYVTFYVSRAWRILPTFILISTIAIGAEVYAGMPLSRIAGTASWGHFVASNLFVLGYEALPQKPLVPGWSLDFELQFYLVAPFILILVQKTARPLLLLGAATLLSAASAIWIGPHVATSFIVFFICGIVAEQIQWRPSTLMGLLSVLLTAAICFACILSKYKGILLIGSHPGPLAAYSIEANILLAITMLPFALYTTRQTGFRYDRVCGDLSFVVYLLHWVGMTALLALPVFIASRITSTLLVIFIVYMLSLCIWKLYDLPINRARSRWVARRIPPRAKC